MSASEGASLLHLIAWWGRVAVVAYFTSKANKMNCASLYEEVVAPSDIESKSELAFFSSQVKGKTDARLPSQHAALKAPGLRCSADIPPSFIDYHAEGHAVLSPLQTWATIAKRRCVGQRGCLLDLNRPMSVKRTRRLEIREVQHGLRSL